MIFENVMLGGKILQGEMKPPDKFEIVDPHTNEIRNIFGLPREKFAQRLGINVAILRNREQRRRKPEGAVRVLQSFASIYGANISCNTSSTRD